MILYSLLNFKALQLHVRTITATATMYNVNSFCKCTWSYENQVSKHLVIIVNFPCLIACFLCCLLMSFVCVCFFAGFVVRDL